MYEDFGLIVMTLFCDDQKRRSFNVQKNRIT